MSAHPGLDRLPQWPGKTIAVLATVDAVPYAIPVSAPVRHGDRRILIALNRERGSLRRLRDCPPVALVVLAEANIAFTAHGHARIVRERIEEAPDYVAVAIEVDRIDDHRQAGFEVDAGISRSWLDSDEQRAQRKRFEALRELAAAEV